MAKVQTMSLERVLQGTPYSVDSSCSNLICTAEWKMKELSWKFVESMEEFGQLAPIILEGEEGEWTQSNGHHRLWAAVALGWDTIDVIIDDYSGNVRWSESEGPRDLPSGGVSLSRPYSDESLLPSTECDEESCW